jgi:hypothetical protein
MDSSTKTTLAVGAAAGYIVGRTSKEKIALGLLSLATGRALDPMSLVGQGIRKLTASPQFEQFSESVAGILEQQIRSLADSEAEGGPEGETSEADADDGKDAPEEEQDLESSQGEQEVGEPEERETGSAQPSQPGIAGQAKAGRPSAREAGPKNPPAAKAKAMGRKAKAERAARRPGPKNPPAARAMARKAADKKAGAEKGAGKGAPARRNGNG